MDYAHKINLCCGVYGIYLTLKEVPGCKKFDNPWLQTLRVHNLMNIHITSFLLVGRIDHHIPDQ